MKVLHICPGYFQRQLYDKLFLVLQSMNVINEVFALSFEKKMLNEGNRSYNIKVLDRHFNLLERFIYFGKQHIIYKKICKEYSINEFSVVHAHTLFSSGFSSYLLHKNFGIPYIVAIRNTDINVFFRYMVHLRGLGRSIMNNAQNIIFLSPSYRDFYIDKYVEKKNRQVVLNKSVVIPNGIDEYFLNNKFLKKRAPGNKLIRLIYIGEINSNKNIETTIKSCKLLLDLGYSVKYTIVGEMLNAKYKEIIARNSFISSYPRCTKEQILFHLRHSDIFVMPSVNESFGIVYAEAMSQGVPVIYSKGQGFDGQFENGIVGFAVDCFDYLNITKKIIELYNNYEQFSKRCVSLVDRFNWLTIAAEYKRIYENHS